MPKLLFFAISVSLAGRKIRVFLAQEAPEIFVMRRISPKCPRQRTSEGSVGPNDTPWLAARAGSPVATVTSGPTIPGYRRSCVRHFLDLRVGFGPLLNHVIAGRNCPESASCGEMGLETVPLRGAESAMRGVI